MGATRVASAITEVIVEGRYAAMAASKYAKETADSRIDWDQVSAIKEKTFAPLEKKRGSRQSK